jgi:hypothetical protein
MTIDTTEVLRQSLADFGLPATLAGQPVTVLFSPERGAADPYTQDPGHPGPRATLLATEAAGVDLDAAILAFGAIEYRIVRHGIRHGALSLFLRGIA